MQKPERLRLLAVDDHLMVRMSLVRALSREDDLIVAGVAESGAHALRLFESLRPDITLINARLSDIQGVEVTRRIVQEHSGARILLVSIDEAAEDIHQALEAGALGCLPKGVEKRLLLQAIRQVAAGKRFVSDDFAQKLAERNSLVSLSEPEAEILRQIAQGKTDKVIAGDLGLGSAGVETHMAQILCKLGVPDRTRAVTVALERGLLRF